MNSKFYVPAELVQQLKAAGCTIDRPTYHEALSWLEEQGYKVFSFSGREGKWAAIVNDMFADMARFATRERALNDGIRVALCQMRGEDYI